MLAWLAIAFLGSALVTRSAFAPALSLVGSVLALLAWGLIEASADDFLAGTWGSLPFLLCLLIH